jgi:hypothetical protein
MKYHTHSRQLAGTPHIERRGDEELDSVFDEIDRVDASGEDDGDPGEVVPFASDAAMIKMNAIVRDDEERDAMVTLLGQIGRNWELGSSPLTGSDLDEAGVAADRMLHVARGLKHRHVITTSEAVWLKDQLAFAGAEIEAEQDATTRRIRARRNAMKQQLGGAASAASGAGSYFKRCQALRAKEAERFAQLKIQILRRGEEVALAKLLERDPADYDALVEAGERSVMRLLRVRAA